MVKLLVVLLVLAAGCGTTAAGRQDTMNAAVAENNRRAKTWIGKNGDDLFVSWGVPDSSVPTSDGGQIVEYQPRVDLGESVRLNPWWLLIRGRLHHHIYSLVRYALRLCFGSRPYGYVGGLSVD